MNPLAKILLDLCFLKAGPQDLPASHVLLAITITCYLIVSILISLVGLDVWKSIGVAMLDVALIAIFLHIMLRFRGFGVRFTQALTALTGTGAVMGFLALPLVPGLKRSAIEESGGEFTALLWLGLMIWSLMILGHIFRYALSTTMTVGLMLGVGYTVFSIAVIQVMFPEVG